MPKKSIEFLTVPDELAEHATAVHRHFSGWWSRVLIEPADPRYPVTPTMICKRLDRTRIVEIHKEVPRARLDDWATYCASCDTNRELALAVPEHTAVSSSDLEWLRSRGIGLYKVTADSVTEVLRPFDLAMHVVLPPPENLPNGVRLALSETYEHWNRGDWKDSFGLATEVIEERSKEYLKREYARGRIVVLGAGGKPLSLSRQKIDKMTLGALAIALANIQAPTDLDSALATTLQTINADRVKLRHFRTKKATSAGFRRRVGPHMHMIVRALRHLMART